MKLIQFGGLVGGAFVMLVATNTFTATLTSGDALRKQPRVDLTTYQLERERASGVTKQLLNVQNGAAVKHGTKAPADVAEAAPIDASLAECGVTASLYPDYSKRPALAQPQAVVDELPTLSAEEKARYIKSIEDGTVSLEDGTDPSFPAPFPTRMKLSKPPTPPQPATTLA